LLFFSAYIQKKAKSRGIHTLVFFSSFSIEKIMENYPPPPPPPNTKKSIEKGMHQIIWEQIRKGLGL